MTKLETVANGTVVALAYLLKDAEGKELDRAETDDPLYYLHGNGQIVPGLEKELSGMKVGDKKDVVVSPDEGYGDIEPSLKLAIPRAQFPKESKIHPGMRFSADGGDGHPVVFTVLGVDGDQVQVDGNHPLAGQTLYFSIEVVTVREATEDEKTHGHVHGPGGAHAH